MLPPVQFLRRRDDPGAAAWWAAVLEFPTSAPALIRELLRGPSVVCDRVEGEQALAWARAHSTWRDDAPALELWDPYGSSGAPAADFAPKQKCRR